MLHRSMFPRLLCIVIVVFLGRTAALAQLPDSAARSVPGDALIYASVDTRETQQFLEQVQNSPLYKALAAGGALKSAQDSGVMLPRLLGMLNQSISGRVGIAIAAEDIQPGKLPSILVILPVKSREQAQSMSLLIPAMAPARQLTRLAEQNYRGITISTFTGGAFKEVSLSLTVMDDCLLVGAGTSLGWLKKAIDANAGRENGLTADAKFTALQTRIAAMGPNAAWIWVDMRHLHQLLPDRSTKTGAITMVSEAGTKVVGNPATLPLDPEAMRSFYTAYDSGAFRLMLSDHAASVESVFLVNRENEIGRRILAQKGGSLRAASLSSDDAILFAGSSSFASTIDVYRELFSAVDANARKTTDDLAGAFQKVTGLSLEQDILGNLGSEFALVLNDMPASPASFPFLIYVQTKDREAMEKTMEKLRRAIGAAMGEPTTLQFVQKDLPQGRIYYANSKGKQFPILPGWTFADDFLVIGTTPAALETSLQLAAGQKNSSLAASFAYQRAVADTGDHLVGVFLLNIQKFAALMNRLQTPQLAANPTQSALAAAAGSTKNVDMAKMQRVLQALQSLSVISTVEHDAVMMRMTLSFDLGK